VYFGLLKEESMTGLTEAGAPELGLFVLFWSNARTEQERILRHAQKLFDVRRVYEIHWTRELLPANYARFNRRRLDPSFRTAIQEHEKAGPILLVTAVDSSPRYEPRVMAKGAAHVNAKFFDARQEFRAWTGEASSVHGSVSATQAARDLMLLLGTDPETHLKENPHPWNGNIEEMRRDLSGARGWGSPTELFYALNHTVRYVVLRNFEGLPHSLHVGSHEDVDLLTDDYQELISVMNARPHVRCVPPRGGPYWVKISGEDMWFDLRFVGDRYYNPTWAREILDRRVWNEGGFFSPSDEDYFESLAYHAVVHKESLSAEYRQRLAAMASSLGRPGWDASALEDPAQVKALLAKILEGQGCGYCRPRDVNVFYNFEAAGHHWPRVRRKLAGIFRKGLRVGYRLWRRINNVALTCRYSRDQIRWERAVQ
jgi:hypothetical protein